MRLTPTLINGARTATSSARYGINPSVKEHITRAAFETILAEEFEAFKIALKAAGYTKLYVGSHPSVSPESQLRGAGHLFAEPKRCRVSGSSPGKGPYVAHGHKGAFGMALSEIVRHFFPMGCGNGLKTCDQAQTFLNFPPSYHGEHPL